MLCCICISVVISLLAVVVVGGCRLLLFSESDTHYQHHRQHRTMSFVGRKVAAAKMVFTRHYLVQTVFLFSVVFILAEAVNDVDKTQFEAAFQGN